jgi:ubiquinone biosynthesis protein
MRVLLVVFTLLKVFIGCTFYATSILLTRSTLGSAKFYTYIGIAVRDALIELGGIWIKVGQLISYRVDIIPAEISAQLYNLANTSRQAKYNPEKEIAQHLGEELFSFIKLIEPIEPLYSGSIADIYSAKYGDADIIIKLIRPNEEKNLSADAFILEFIEKSLKATRNDFLIAISDIFLKIKIVSINQLNLEKEAEYLSKTCNFLKSDKDIYIPKIFDIFTRKNLIVMERLNNLSSFYTKDNQSLSEAKSAVQVALKLLYKMIFQYHLVHCDLHPGNIFYRQTGKVVVLDFGICWQLSKDQAEKFRKFFFGIVVNKPKYVCDSLLASSELCTKCFDEQLFRVDIQLLIQTSYRKTVGEFQISNFVAQLFVILRKHKLTIDEDFFIPVMSLLIFEGILKYVDRDIDFQHLSMPFFFDLAMSDIFKWHASREKFSVPRKVFTSQNLL